MTAQTPTTPTRQYADRLRAFAPGGSAEQDRARVKALAPPVSVDGSVATVRIYDVIDDWGEWWGISAREFTQAIDDIPAEVDTISVLINSPGGIVYDGLAILNSLRAHKARIVARVEGLAASIASTIAVAADELVMMPNTELMIHDAWAMVVGNPADMRAAATDLDRVSDNMASIYAAKAGGSVAEWRERMGLETWYSAEEAVAAGLANSVFGAEATDDDEAEDPAAQFDLSIFKYAGRAKAPTPKLAGNSDEDQRRRARQLALIGMR